MCETKPKIKQNSTQQCPASGENPLSSFVGNGFPFSWVHHVTTTTKNTHPHHHHQGNTKICKLKTILLHRRPFFPVRRALSVLDEIVRRAVQRRWNCCRNAARKRCSCGCCVRGTRGTRCSWHVVEERERGTVGEHDGSVVCSICLRNVRAFQEAHQFGLRPLNTAPSRALN